MPSNMIGEFFNLEEYAHAKLFEGCAYPWEALARLESYLFSLTLGNIEIAIPSGVFLDHPEWISIGEGSVIEPGALIRGPCILGKNCIVRHGAYIRGNLLVGDRCVIGHGSELKHSILLNEVAVAHFNYVGNSLLGNQVNLAAGATCANARFDRTPIRVMLGQERKETGLKKLGAIIGDGTQVGCHCVLNPGTVLGKHVVCFPGLNIYGFIPKSSKLKLSVKNIVE